MADVEGVDPDIQTRPLDPGPGRRDVPDDAALDALEDERDPDEFVDDRGPLPDGADTRTVLPDDEREVDDGYAGEEDVAVGSLGEDALDGYAGEEDLPTGFDDADGIVTAAPEEER